MIPMFIKVVNISIGWFIISSASDLYYSTYDFLPVTKHTIPVLGNVHCGTPEYTEEDYIDVVDTDIDADFALRALGDSMIGAGIEDNDLVYVRRQPAVENGELAVVLINS